MTNSIRSVSAQKRSSRSTGASRMWSVHSARPPFCPSSPVRRAGCASLPKWARIASACASVRYNFAKGGSLIYTVDVKTDVTLCLCELSTTSITEFSNAFDYSDEDFSTYGTISVAFILKQLYFYPFGTHRTQPTTVVPQGTAMIYVQESKTVTWGLLGLTEEELVLNFKAY